MPDGFVFRVKPFETLRIRIIIIKIIQINKHCNGSACLFLYENNFRTLGTRSASWGYAFERRGSGKSESKAGAAVEKIANVQRKGIVLCDNV